MRRLASALLIFAMVLMMFAPPSHAVVNYPYLSITLDKTEYTPGDTAVATVKIHNYPAGLASVTTEMLYDSMVLGEPTAPPDLSGSLLSMATYVVTNPRPGEITVNLSQAPTGTSTMGAEATLFTLQFPVLMTAPNNSSKLRFSPVTGLLEDGVLLLDTNDATIEDSGNIDGNVTVWMGGTIKGRVTLRNRATGHQDYSGTLVTLYDLEGPIKATTNSLGDFTIPNAPEGLKEIYVTRPGYLSAEVYHVPVARGEVTDLTPLGVSLIPGNIVESPSLNPDTIFLEDLAGLARSIGSSATTTGTTSFQTTWNAAADLDGDGSVGGSDLALLAQNWGLGGAEGYRRSAEGTVFGLPLVDPATTTLTVTAPSSGVQFSDEVELGATLTDEMGVPLPYKMVEFHLGDRVRVSATDLNGVVTVKMRVTAPVGAATFRALFKGDQLNASNEKTGSFTVTPEDAELVFTGPTVVSSGTNTLSFHLNQALDGSLTMMGPGSVAAAATPLAGSSLEVVTGTGTWDIYGDGYLNLTLANVPYTLSLVTAPGSSYTAPEITRTLMADSSLTLTGTQSAEAGSTVSFVATLTPAMANRSITFSLDGISVAQVQTDSAGRATATFTLDDYVGWQLVEAEFFGDPYLTPSSAWVEVETTQASVQPATTTLTLGSMSYSAYVGDPLTITATLASETGGLGSQGVWFNIYDANTMEWVLSSTGSLTTDNTGLATWVISSVNLAAGTYAVEAAFDGTTEWASSTSPKVPLGVSQPAVSNSIGALFQMDSTTYSSSASVTQGSTIPLWGKYSVVATDTFSFAFAPYGTESWTTLGSYGTVDGVVSVLVDTTKLATGTYTFGVSDSQGLSGTATLEVTEPINQSPTITAPSSVTINEDQVLAFNPALSVTDDGTGVTVIVSAGGGFFDAMPTSGVTLVGTGTSSLTLTGSPANVNTALGSLSYTPPLNYVGIAEIGVVVDDTVNPVASATITVNIFAVNDSPMVPSTQSVEVVQDSTSNTITVTATDADATSLTAGTDPNYPPTGNVAAGTSSCSPITGGGVECTFTFSYSPATGYTGQDSFTVIVSDGALTATQSIDITVTTTVSLSSVGLSAETLVVDGVYAVDAGTQISVEATLTTAVSDVTVDFYLNPTTGTTPGTLLASGVGVTNGLATWIGTVPNISGDYYLYAVLSSDSTVYITETGYTIRIAPAL